MQTECRNCHEPLRPSWNYCPRCAQPLVGILAYWRADIVARGEWISLDGRVSPETVARLLDRSLGTLANWRSRGTGPEYRRDKRITYHLESVADWFTQLHDCTAQHEGSRYC